jgi:hypothetical protein
MLTFAKPFEGIKDGPYFFPHRTNLCIKVRDEWFLVSPRFEYDTVVPLIDLDTSDYLYNAYFNHDGGLFALKRFTDDRHKFDISFYGDPDEQYIYFDGSSYGPFDNISSITTSISGTSYGFIASKDGKDSVNVNGEWWGPDNWVGDIDFSQDGKNWTISKSRSGGMNTGDEGDYLYFNGDIKITNSYKSDLCLSTDGSFWAYKSGTWAEPKIITRDYEIGPFNERHINILGFSLDGTEWLIQTMDFDELGPPRYYVYMSGAKYGPYTDIRVYELDDRTGIYCIEELAENKFRLVKFEVEID